MSITDDDVLRDVVQQLHRHLDQERLQAERIAVLSVEVNALTQQLALLQANSERQMERMHRENQTALASIIAKQETQGKSITILERIASTWAVVWRLLLGAGALLLVVVEGAEWVIDRLWPRHLH